MEWTRGETGEQDSEAYADGYVATVRPVEDDGDGAWFWCVEATSEVSEWPEVFACGQEPTEADAKRQAEKAMVRANA